MKRLIFVGLFLLLAAPVRAAPVFSNATSSNHDTVTYATHDHVTTATADRLMLVCVAHSYATETETVTSVFYNTTQEATPVVDVVNAGGDIRLWLFALIAPASGTLPVEVAFNEWVLASVGVMTFTGAHQTTALGTAATDGGSLSVVATVVSSAIDELVADCANIVDDAATITYGSQTERFNSVFPFAWQLNGSTAPGASPNVTMIRDWGGTPTFQYVNHIGVSIKPAATAAVARRRSPSFQ